MMISKRLNATCKNINALSASNDIKIIIISGMQISYQTYSRNLVTSFLKLMLKEKKK